MDWDPTASQYITQSKLPVIYFHANNDPAASVNNSKNGLAAINALNPVIPAKGVFYADGGHDVTSRAFDVDRFPWTGNELPATLYEYALPLTKKIHRPSCRSHLGLSCLWQLLIISTLTRTRSLWSEACLAMRLQISRKWSCIEAPAGVSIWSVNGCGYINCEKVILPAEGVYKFRLTVADAAGLTATKDITVIYSTSGTPQEPEPPLPPVKVIIGRFFYGGWELIIYNDGSTEKK